MSKRESIARYSLIIKKLRKRPATFAALADYLAVESEIQAYNFNVSKRTFQRDVEDIFSLFNIEILYDFSKKVYYIASDEQPEASARIIEAFDTFNALNVSDKLSGFIHFEARKPQGTEHLYGLLHAIKNKVQIKFTYQKYWESEKKARHVEPYALKEFKNRWYVLAKDLGDNAIKSFALDRLTELEILKKPFELPANFDVNEHYKFSFGIISPNGDKPEVVLLSFNAFQGKYIKSLPLHSSQQVLIDNEEELQIKLSLYVTHDLVMELLSYGDTVQVLAPKMLIKQMKQAHKTAYKQYDK